jgi:outer membrane protein W
MKTKMLMALLLAMSTSAFAQDSGFTQYFTAGPRVGINFSNIDGVDDGESKAGLLAGGFLVYSFHEHFGAGLDVLYSMEGVKFENDIPVNGTSVKFTNTTRLDYLRIPVQAFVFFGQHGNAFRPKLSLGPCLGFLLSAENKVENEATSDEETIDIKDNFKSTDFGAIVGAGFNYRLAESVWLNTDLRYYIGATELQEDEEQAEENDADPLKNNGFSFSLGVGFGL